LRGCLVQFELRTHLLQPRSQCFKLLLLLRNGRSQFVHCAVLFEKLVEQHRIDGVVADGVRLSLFIGQHQGGIYLGDFFSNQTKLREVLNVALVVKRYGLSDRIASLAFSMVAMSFLNRSEETPVPS